MSCEITIANVHVNTGAENADRTLNAILCAENESCATDRHAAL